MISLKPIASPLGPLSAGERLSLKPVQAHQTLTFSRLGPFRQAAPDRHRPRTGRQCVLRLGLGVEREHDQLCERPCPERPAVVDAGSANAGQVVEFDLGSAITGNGTYAIGDRGGGSDPGFYGSRESGTPAQLVLTLAP